MNKPKVIIFSEIHYDFLRQRHQNISEQYCENGYEVIFISRVYSRVPAFKELINLSVKKFLGKNKVNIEKKYPTGIRLKKSFYLPNINKLFNYYNRFVGVLVSRYYSDAALVHSFNNNPELIRGFNRAIKVVDVIHNWWDYDYRTNWQISNIEESMALSDLIITDSGGMLNKIEKEYAQFVKKAIVVPPGVEDKWLSSNLNIGEVKKGIFFGNLRANSDVSLIVQLIQSGYDIDLYGLIDESIDKKYNIILNSRYKGCVSADYISQNIEQYGFILLPYKSNVFSNTIAPAKYFECLATGKLLISNSKLNHMPGWDLFVKGWEFSDPESVERIIKNRSIDNMTEQRNLAQNYSWTKVFQEYTDSIRAIKKCI
jgi:hypothetical protein